MEEKMPAGCTPDQCDGCAGCSGNMIEKISLKVEWRHKGESAENEAEVAEMMNELSADMMVSGVELTYINNTFSPDIPDNSSEFWINGRTLASLVPEVSSPVSWEIVRKGVFQALLQNL